MGIVDFLNACDDDLSVDSCVEGTKGSTEEWEKEVKKYDIDVVMNKLVSVKKN